MTRSMCIRSYPGRYDVPQVLLGIRHVKSEVETVGVDFGMFEDLEHGLEADALLSDEASFLRLGAAPYTGDAPARCPA